MKSGSLNIIFEVFEDETFENLFQQFKMLSILEKTLKKMKENAKKNKSNFSKEEFAYIQESLTNLNAFVDYKNYEKFVK